VPPGNGGCMGIAKDLMFAQQTHDFQALAQIGWHARLMGARPRCGVKRRGQALDRHRCRGTRARARRDAGRGAAWDILSQRKTEVPGSIAFCKVVVFGQNRSFWALRGSLISCPESNFQLLIINALRLEVLQCQTVHII
jgi:hypothetical protein